MSDKPQVKRLHEKILPNHAALLAQISGRDFVVDAHHGLIHAVVELVVQGIAWWSAGGERIRFVPPFDAVHNVANTPIREGKIGAARMVATESGTTTTVGRYVGEGV